jgi:hypothetical protein
MSLTRVAKRDSILVSALKDRNINNTNKINNNVTIRKIALICS